MMLFHVLDLCGVCCLGVHDTSQVECSPYREASEYPALQAVELGVVPYTGSYFPCFSLCFEEKTTGGN